MLSRRGVLGLRALVVFSLLAGALPACGARTALRPPGADTPSDVPRATDVASPLDATPDVVAPDVVAPDASVPDVVAHDVVAPDVDLGCLRDPARCDDNDVCTDDRCLPDGTCSHRAVVCDDGNACTDDRCDPRLGCVTSPTSCDDRSVCTVDRCDPATGCAHATISCDDRDPCTTDRCDPTGGCVHATFECGGCADGRRDAFGDRARYPRIAGCAGGFGNPGLSRESSPTCDRGAGDDGPNPNGRGCSASDLCALGWHVCRSDADVATHSPDGCAGASDADARSFFATRQTGPGCGHCSTGSDPTCDNSSCREGCAQTERTTNDIFGCGSLGDAPQASSCRTLDRFSNNVCSSLEAPWRCDDDPAGLRESDVVVKPGPARGGVLCCID